MMAVDVSVVISVYGSIEDFQITLKSILAQTHTNYEVIVVDDGNSCEKMAAIRADIEKFSRVRIIRNEKNLGLTKSLIKGCDAADGAFLARIDSGDLMVPATRLETQHKQFINDPDLAICAGRHEVVDALNHLCFQSHPDTSRYTADSNIRPGQSLFFHASVMMRKSAYKSAGGYDPAHYYGQDTELWPRILEYGDGLVSDEVFVIGPMWPHSISVLNNRRQIRGKMKAIVQSSARYGIWSLVPKLLFEAIKLVIPVRARVFLRYYKNMDYIRKIPSRSCTNLENISRFYQEIGY